ncbi:MAG: AI-2E family transporter [Pedobacter sp.]|nr:MAG: AI-2E family transporter [Pedobacter sp.]
MPALSYNQRNQITLLIIIALALLIAYSLGGIFSSILSTLVLYTLLRPLYIYLVDEKSWNKRIAAIFLIVMSLIILVLPFYTLSSMMINKIAELNNDQIYFNNILYKIRHLFDFSENAGVIIEDALKNAGNWLAGLFPSLITGVFNIVFGLLLMYFLLYFMLIERHSFEKALLKYAPFREQNSIRFAEEMRNTTFANVLGQGFISIVQGSLVSLCFYIFNYNDPIFWGVITTFLSFVPILGPPVIFVPAALLKISEGQNFDGWGLLVVGFVVIINIDNVLRFIIAKRVGNIHPIITVIGVVIGLPLFGILGLVFGPLLLSYFVLLVKIYESSTQASKQLKKIKLNPEQGVIIKEDN